MTLMVEIIVYTKIKVRPHTYFVLLYFNYYISYKEIPMSNQIDLYQNLALKMATIATGACKQHAVINESGGLKKDRGCLPADI